MPVLMIRDGNGNFIPINAIKGNNGKSAYEQAIEGGYNGTEEEFISILNTVLSGYDIDHFLNYENPHNVTKEQIGLCNVENTSDANKPISIAQQIAIDEAKQSGDNAYERITQHELNTMAHICLDSNYIYIDGNQIMTTNPLKICSERLPIATGTYKGTNKYGESNPNTITFDFVPKIVIVSKNASGNATSGNTFIWINPGSVLNFINNGSNSWCHPTLDGTTLSWYCNENASYQLNSSSYEYNYLAIG